MALPFYLFKLPGIANFLMFIAISFFLHNLFGYKVLRKFQTIAIPAMMRKYENTLVWVLKGKTTGIYSLGYDWSVCLYNDP